MLSQAGLERDAAGLIRWRRDSSDHPRNWTLGRKLFSVSVIILLELFTTIISTTGAAVAHTVGPRYNLENIRALVAFVSMYQIGQAIGGYLIPPLSELTGRWLPYFISSLVFSIFCIVIPLGSSAAAIHVGRFVTGFASAVPSVVIAGSIEDLFNAKHRVWAVIVWNASTTVALCLGPIYAALVIDSSGWEWVFYSAGIGTLVLCAALLGVKETRPSVVLSRKIELLRTTTNIVDLRWANADPVQSRKAFAYIVLIRPMYILLTEPLVILIAIISGVSWSIIYLFTDSIIQIYGSMGFTRTQSSLVFLSIAVGVLLTLLPRFPELQKLQHRAQDQPVEPEAKLRAFAYAAPALTVGLIWFAWTIPPVTHPHWIVPTLSLVPIGFAVNETAYTLSGFLADSYTLYSASVFSGLAFARATISGTMPLVAHVMYSRLNPNIAASILAGISALFCLLAVVFVRHSKTLRKRSPFAGYSSDMHQRTQIEVD
ncbi:major facilitator superfamily transporter [Stachybotrys elegans]|uniref:Major facilitator superfamily transporter n=1 Tax=Stachybotrys elegans TaxID=80388 RepID=A0A8K0SLL2_9HYPO|nr:major facilitator superfamily transporter [Stachybotrys elegans]